MTVCSGTRFRVEVTHRTRMQKGKAIQGRLLESVYAENHLLVPRGTLVEGSIAAVEPAPHSKRLDAKFHGDFTPLAQPVIHWNLVSRSDGGRYPLLAESAGDAGSTLYFLSASSGHPSLFRRAWSTLVGRKDAAVETVTAPDKLERLQKYIWSQLPYHPQYVEQGSQFEMALTEDLRMPIEPPPVEANSAGSKPLDRMVTVHSRLRTDLNSAQAKAGDPVEAIVTEPVMDEANRLVIPQNSILHGSVLRAAPSGRWGRNGVLRFAFDKVTWPSGYQQEVEAVPTAIEGSPGAKLQIDQEGGVAPQTDRGIAAPLVMGLLSASALGDNDGALGKAAISSNGFAFVGRALAIGTGSRYVGGTIGAFATGRDIYTRYLAHGKDVLFGNETEVQLEISPAHAKRMTPVH